MSFQEKTAPLYVSTAWLNGIINKMKKAALIFFLILIALLFTPDFAFAQAPRINCPTDIDPNALVPCGGPTCPCTLCDFFLSWRNIFKVFYW